MGACSAKNREEMEEDAYSPTVESPVGPSMGEFGKGPKVEEDSVCAKPRDLTVWAFLMVESHRSGRKC